MKLNYSTAQPRFGDRQRWLALFVICFGQLMIMLDSTIVNVALPSIQHDLSFTQADLTWVVNAYLIAYGSFLLVAGRAGDLIGRKKVFLAGGSLLTPPSVFCANAHLAAAPRTLRFGGLATALVGVSLVVEVRVRHPLMPRRMLRIRCLAGASAARALLTAGMFTNFFVGALFLQHVHGFSAFATGLAFLP